MNVLIFNPNRNMFVKCSQKLLFSSIFLYLFYVVLFELFLISKCIYDCLKLVVYVHKGHYVYPMYNFRYSIDICNKTILTLK